MYHISASADKPKNKKYGSAPRILAADHPVGRTFTVKWEHPQSIKLGRIVSPADMEIIASQLKRVYSDAQYVGSLVVDGPSQRVTEYDDPKEEPADWWESFWQRFESNTGMSPEQARDLLQSLGVCARNCSEFQK